MITMNMTNKREVRITDKHFSLENDVLTLTIDIGDYDITGKQITAVFEPEGVETAPLTAEIAEGVTTVSLPIYSSYIAEGVNYIQLYFRWDSTKLEQSDKMMWVVERSLVADDPGVEQQDLMSYYLQQITLAIAEADRVVDEAGDVRIELDESTASATAINNTLTDPATGTIKLATDAKSGLDQSIIDAGVAKDALTDPVTGAIKLAEDAKGDIEQAIIDNEIVTQTEFIAHKEESVYQHMFVNRDISIIGTQTIATNFKAKYIKIEAVVNNTSAVSWGNWAENISSHAIGTISNGLYAYGSNSVVYLTIGSAVVVGKISNIQEKSFDLTWEILAGTPTGQARLQIIIGGH